jgi:uncharacterized RDD family membrane protein YckC
MGGAVALAVPAASVSAVAWAADSGLGAFVLAASSVLITTMWLIEVIAYGVAVGMAEADRRRSELIPTSPTN